MDMRETRISGEYFFEGRIMKARVDEVRLPNGKQASREVCEHVGGAMYPSPGFLTEVTYLFAALDLTEGETHPDEDEFVETVRLPIAEVERLIAEDRLRDAKTIAARYRARLKNLF